MRITNSLIDGIAEFRLGGISPTLITLGTRTYENIREEGNYISRCKSASFFGIRVEVSDNRYEMRVT